MMSINSGKVRPTTAGQGWVQLAQRVVYERCKLGMLTRGQLAKKAGFSDRLLGDIECARRTNYDPTTLAMLERALGWESGSVDVILAGGDPIRPAGDTADEDDDFAVLKVTLQKVMDSPLPETVKLQTMAEAMELREKQVRAKQRFERQQASEREQVTSRWLDRLGGGGVPRQGFHPEWRQPELI